MLEHLAFYAEELKNNFRAGCTVALVNVPLSISLSIAGGAGPVAGIVTAFWSGLFGAVLGGSEFNIVGPTGALSGILAAAASAYNPLILPWLSIFGGAFSLLVWLFDLVNYLMVIPSSVVHGFTAGVAVIIGLGQLDFAIGLEIHHDHSLNFYEKVIDSLKHVQEVPSPVPFLFFLFQVFTLRYLFKHYSRVPWPVIYCIVGAIFGILGQLHDIYPLNRLITLGQHFAGIDLSLKLFTLPVWSEGVLSYSVFADAAAISFIGILETLISARMADEMHGKTHHDRNKELVGLGVANIVGGMFGGIPATAALARTSLNVQSGATSRISGILNAFVLLLLSNILLPYFKFVPMATVAAILTMVAIRMVDVSHLHHLYVYDKTQFSIAMFTAFLCISVDTMSGLILGSIVSLLIYAENLSHGMSEMLIYLEVPTVAEKKFIAEVHVQKLDSCALPDHLARLFEEYHRMQWERRVGDDAIEVARENDVENGEVTPLVSQKNGDVEYSTLSSRSGRATGREEHLFPLLMPNGNSSEQSYFFPSKDVQYALVYRIAGQLTYINASSHMERAEKIVSRLDGFDTVVISLRTVWSMDLDGVDALEGMIGIFKEKKKRVIVDGVSRLRHMFEEHDFFKTLDANGCCYEKWISDIKQRNR
eukprot:gene8941-9864_t